MPRNIIPVPIKRAPRPAPEFDEPVFIEQEPVISHEHRNEMRRWNRAPHPYQLGKWDGPWIFVLFLVAGGFAFKPLRLPRVCSTPQCKISLHHGYDGSPASFHVIAGRAMKW